jgi:hypothetical protein
MKILLSALSSPRIASSLTLLAMMAAFFSCVPKNAGQLTLVNSGVEPIKVYVDERSFSIRPTGHITKDVAPGRHEIRVDSGPPTIIHLQKGLTTVFDSSGLSCFAVVDYTQRYSGGRASVVEKIEDTQVFTTNGPLITVLGSYLPKELKPGRRALRLHQIDCEILPDDAKIIEEVGVLP